jgi:hypothetical protein
MRTVTWNSGDPEMHFDNPNLRWGDPACLMKLVFELRLGIGQKTLPGGFCPRRNHPSIINNQFLTRMKTRFKPANMNMGLTAILRSNIC